MTHDEEQDLKCSRTQIFNGNLEQGLGLERLKVQIANGQIANLNIQNPSFKIPTSLGIWVSKLKESYVHKPKQILHSSKNLKFNLKFTTETLVH